MGVRQLKSILYVILLFLESDDVNYVTGLWRETNKLSQMFISFFLFWCGSSCSKRGHRLLSIELTENQRGLCISSCRKSTGSWIRVVGGELFLHTHSSIFCCCCCWLNFDFCVWLTKRQKKRFFFRVKSYLFFPTFAREWEGRSSQQLATNRYRLNRRITSDDRWASLWVVSGSCCNCRKPN